MERAPAKNVRWWLFFFACACSGASDPPSACSTLRDGTPLTCGSSDARRVSANRYDRLRKCFVEKQIIEDLCLGPPRDVSGSGAVSCFVSPTGDAFTVYMRYGEDPTNSCWHTDGNSDFPSTLTPAEEALCRELWDAADGVIDPADGGALDERLLSAEGTPAQMSPLCSDGA